MPCIKAILSILGRTGNCVHREEGKQYLQIEPQIVVD